MNHSNTPNPIGSYELIKLIAKGGMGEVWLAKDPICEREIALKKIRSDLKNQPALKNRFLKEAKLTSQLTHPGVIAIYSIHQEEDELYYTMPFVEGNTLKQLFRTQPPPSIATLMPIFRSICQTLAYIHSKGIIHRDLKPENILVGKFGEVIILDWGLIQFVQEKETELSDQEDDQQDLTSPGKIVGTLAFMSPERAFGKPASFQSDIYSLGVILYQMLTLQLPFSRKNLKELKKSKGKEKWTDPEEAAPYRDVPFLLSKIVKKCLEPDTTARYLTVEDLIYDLEGYLEGRSEWFESAKLAIERKKDWEFQENILISNYIAITQSAEHAEWVSLMVSKMPFAENSRLKTRVYIGEEGNGLGFLLSIPESSERDHPLEGFCLWMGSDLYPYTQLFRNTVEVLRLPDLFLKRKQWNEIIIEKADQNISLTLNGIKRMSYQSFLPLIGTHVGLLYRDTDFVIEDLVVSIRSPNLKVSCLSIPDAFLASKDYKRALAEYRRIGLSFPGQFEGREALFRAGITLAEQARATKNEKKSLQLFSAALDEFSKLHNTPSGPLEYLGKSATYFAMKDTREEINCLELALRRYPTHPLINSIKEQILYRMHESAQKDRKTTYRLILLVLNQLPEAALSKDSLRLFRYVIAHWEPLYFLENPIEPSILGIEEDLHLHLLNRINFSTPLSFWLAEKSSFYELFTELKNGKVLESELWGNFFYCLFELGSFEAAIRWIEEIKEENLSEDLLMTIKWFSPLTIFFADTLGAAFDQYFSLLKEDFGVKELRTLLFLFERAIDLKQEEQIHKAVLKISHFPISIEDSILIDAYRIWAYLQENHWREAEAIFDKYSLELLNQETTLLHPLYGCWLLAVEGEEIAKIHFAGVIDTPFPRSWALLGHEITSKITENPSWISTSFLWERRRLYQLLSLYFHCGENPQMESYCGHLAQKETLKID